MKKRFILLVCFLAVSVSTFPFPEVDHHNYYGQIFYSPSKSILGYIVTKHNDSNLKTREDIYDANGYLIKYKTFEYDASMTLTRETEYNRDQKVVGEINYENQDNLHRKKTITKANRISIFADYEYAFYKNKILYEIETYYYDSEFEDQKYTISQKSLFTYRKGNEKLVEHFIINHEAGEKDYTFQSAEVYRYRSNSQLKGIISIDKRHKLKKYVKYIYGKDNKIWKIKIYKVNPDIKWSGSLENLSSKSFNLSKVVVFEYTPDLFKSLEGIKQKEPKPIAKTEPKLEEDADIRPDIKVPLKTIIIE